MTKTTTTTTQEAPTSLIASIITPSPVAKDNRPWYKVKRVIGTAIGIVGGAMVATGGTLIVATVAGIPITVATVGWVVVQSGIAVFGYGWGANNQKIADEGK